VPVGDVVVVGAKEVGSILKVGKSTSLGLGLGDPAVLDDIVYI
jgi:hypothetical protein